jgi:putative spermidine/putrescine transport system permease protein
MSVSVSPATDAASIDSAPTATQRPDRSGPSPRVRSSAWRPVLATALLMLPAAVALGVLFFYPLVQILRISVTQPELGLGNYIELFTDGYTVNILLRTLWTAFLVAVMTIALAFPFAYAMTIVKPVTRAVLFTIVLIPFWTSSVGKNFVFLALFQRNGVVHTFFSWFGIDLPLVGTTFGVTIAMSQVLLPFAVLPLFARLGQIDLRLVEAAQGLGASKFVSFLRVYLPLSAPGLIAGAILVFVLSLGFYVTPAMLGSPQHAMIAQLIMARVQMVLDMGGAGAIGIFLLAVTLVSLGVSRLVAGQVASGATGMRASK